MFLYKIRKKSNYVNIEIKVKNKKCRNKIIEIIITLL